MRKDNENENKNENKNESKPERWALLDGEQVAEITDLDPQGRFHGALIWMVCPPEVEAGWAYQGDQFIPPCPGPYYEWLEGQWTLNESAETEGLKQAALNQRNTLMNTATAAIAPLQDAMELGEATPEEEAALTEWKRYRVALNRLEQQDGFPRTIEWPEQAA